MVDGWPTLIYVIYVGVPGKKNKREFGWFVIIEVVWWFLAKKIVQYKFPEHVFSTGAIVCQGYDMYMQHLMII